MLAAFNGDLVGPVLAETSPSLILVYVGLLDAFTGAILDPVLTAASALALLA